MSAYKSHVRSINTALHGSGVQYMTVHRMLGGENDVIIFATTRSNSRRDLGFISHTELLKVATSRQLRKQIILGDNGESFSEGSSASNKIHDFVNKHGSYVRLP